MLRGDNIKPSCFDLASLVVHISCCKPPLLKVCRNRSADASFKKVTTLLQHSEQSSLPPTWSDWLLQSKVTLTSAATLPLKLKVEAFKSFMYTQEPLENHIAQQQRGVLCKCAARLNHGSAGNAFLVMHLGAIPQVYLKTSTHYQPSRKCYVVLVTFAEYIFVCLFVSLFMKSLYVLSNRLKVLKKFWMTV